MDWTLTHLVLVLYPAAGGAPQQLRLEPDPRGPLSGIVPQVATWLPTAEAVNLAEHVAAHPCRAAVLAGPQGSGKTLLAQPLCALLGLARVVDEGWGDVQPQDGALLIHQRLPVEAAS